MFRAPVTLVFITHAFTGTTVNTTEHITLTFPIEHDGLPIKEIALRRPTVGDHLTAQKAAGTDADRKIRLIANLAELPPAVIHRLDMKDYAQLPILRTCSKRKMALPSIRQALEAIKIGA